MKKQIIILTALGLLGAWFPGALSAQTNVAKAPAAGNRYLLVVDTSSAMKRRSEGTEKAVADLLLSGIEGELQPGDTLGLWTFNEDIYTGRFPLQHWSADDKQAIASRVVSFLKAQKYEKDANLQKLLAAVGSLIKGSESITVMVVSDGSQELHGTPFDARINEFYKQWSKGQKKARLPFVTVFRGQGGKAVNYAVTASPWPLDMRKSAPEPKTTDITQSQLLEAVRKTQVPTAVPPLIISGKKPKTTMTTNQATVTPPITNRIVASVSESNTPETTATKPSVPQVKLAPTDTASVPPSPATNPPADSPKVETVRPAEIVSTPPVQAMKPDITPGTVTSPVTVVPEPQTHAPEPTNPPAPKPVSPSLATPAATKPFTESTPVPTVVAATPQETTSPATLQRPQVSNLQPAAQGTIAPPSVPASAHRGIWITGIVIAGIGIGCLVAWLRRPATAGVSLITQSIDRDPKP